MGLGRNSAKVRLEHIKNAFGYLGGRSALLMRPASICIAIALCTGLLLGCRASEPSPTPTTGAGSSATPTTSIEPSPVPDPTSPLPTPSPLPLDSTPQPDTGIVRGRLVEPGRPSGGQLVYLAPVLKPVEPGSIGVARLDPASDPRADADEAGQFIFLDVLPGQYALALMSPVGAVLIQGSDGGDIIVTVEPGQAVDLGPVQISAFVQ